MDVLVKLGLMYIEFTVLWGYVKTVKRLFNRKKMRNRLIIGAFILWVSVRLGIIGV